MANVARNIEPEIRDVLASSRVGAILGPRQAGKSTLAIDLQTGGLLPDYYTLDREPIRAAALEDPDGFMAGIRKPAVIDEIQRAPDLMLAIKLVVDRDDSCGQFLITGSANLLTFRAVADALPGRVIYVNLWPFSQGEIEGRRERLIDHLLAGRPPHLSDEPTGRPAHAERIVRGGFPNAYRLTDRQRSRYFESYVGDVLERDLPIEVDIRAGAEKPGQLLRLLAARSGNLVNFTTLADQIELDGKTVKAHVALLEELFLVYRLRPWSRNLRTRHVKTPKLLLTDTGLMSALIGVDAARYSAVDQGELAGMLLETFVTMELVKQQTWADARVQLFFYRDKEQREVDVVIESVTGDVAGVEVKAAASVGRADTRGLRFLRDKLGDRFKAGIVLYTGSTTLQIGERIWAVPLRGLWAGGDAG